MRYKITVEYDGSAFVGWQRQQSGMSVQQVLENALKIISHQDVIVYGSGRTDTGVHALGQVAHFDLETKMDTYRLQGAMNALVRPHPVCVKNVECVQDDFHARFDAKQRTYVYRIQNTPYPPVLNAKRVCHYALPLDEKQMQQAANLLIGKHDFSTFRAADCQAKSPVKTIDSITVKRHQEMIEITVSAKSFLYHQIRNIAGTLMLVGCGKWTVQDFQNALDACDRTKGGPTAVPDGLYFVGVRY